MTKRRFRAAAVQTLARLGDFDFNIALATQYVEDAVRQGAELIVFPLPARRRVPPPRRQARRRCSATPRPRAVASVKNPHRALTETRQQE